MLFSRNWLADYVDFPADPQELARRLTFAGLAVEGTEDHGGPGGDMVFDIDVTTNRPDCMNHLGVAREAAVLLGRPLRMPAASPLEGPEATAEAASVRIEDPVGCPRYCARVVRDIKVGPSPDWLRARLEAIGLRSINNVVDVTNFILWEMGQPLHAFDLAKLAGGSIVVRRARPGETRLVTLDSAERALDEESLVIADAERPVALAGVMGGLDSEVTEATRDILIESAHFDRKTVRRLARRLGMHTDASHRFERGSDPELTATAASRAAALIAELAGGTVLSGVIDVRSDAVWERSGRLDLAKLNAFGGVEIRAEDVETWLSGLGFRLRRLEEDGGGVSWAVTVPSWRYFDFDPRPEPPHEVYPADLYEEVLRVHGLDSIPSDLPAITGSDGPQTPSQVCRARVRRHLAGCGYAEAINFAFQDPAADAAYPVLQAGAASLRPLRLSNPLSERYSVMRRSLVPNLIESARFNQRRGAPSVRLFEVGDVYFGEDPDRQPEHVGLVCGGRTGSPWDRDVELDFFDLKGAVDTLGEVLGVPLTARPATLPGLLPGNTAELERAGRPGETVGFLGRVESEEGYPLFVAEIALAALTEGAGIQTVAIPSRFPGIEADFTLAHPREVRWDEIRGAVAELAPADLVSWGLKDRYQGPKAPDGTVKSTLTFLYNARERSLTQEEVNARQLALNQELERRFGWKG